MEIIKQNEQFTLNKVLENGWIIEGNATKHTSGTLSFGITIIEKSIVENTEKEDVIGELSYSTYKDGRFNMCCNTVEKNRVVLIQCVSPIIDEVLDYFK